MQKVVSADLGRGLTGRRIQRAYLNTYVMPLRIVSPGEMTDKGSNINRRRRLTEEEREKAIGWRREDLTYEEIGVLLGGVSPSTLERYLKGVKPEERVRPSGLPPRQVGPSQPKLVRVPGDPQQRGPTDVCPRPEAALTRGIERGAMPPY